MLTQTEDSLNALRSLYSLAVLAAIIGAVFDYRYKRAGGVRPSRKQRRYLVAALLGSFVFVMLLGAMGAEARWMGRRLYDLFVLVFIFWELWRWLLRRSHPLNRAQPH